MTNEQTGLMENAIESTGKKRCLRANCRKVLKGRTEKRFCNEVCRYAYHNIRKIEENRIISTIVNAIKRNRRILAALLKEKQATSVPEKRLIEKGFNFQYYTHTYYAKKTGREYIFCFDVGYRVLEDGCYQIVRSF